MRLQALHDFVSAIEGEGVGLIGHGGTKKEKEEEEEKYRGAKPKKEDACGAHTTQKRLFFVNVSASGHTHASHLFTKLGELAFGSQSRDHSPTVALEYTGDCGGIPTS